MLLFFLVSWNNLPICFAFGEWTEHVKTDLHKWLAPPHNLHSPTNTCAQLPSSIGIERRNNNFLECLSPMLKDCARTSI